MSSNVGLSTPRGSGTSGYVQKNLSYLKPRDKAAPYPKDLPSLKHRQRQPDGEILEHNHRREVEIKVLELRDKLEEEGVDEDEIEEQASALRKKLEAERTVRGASKSRDLKMHQVHELAKAKIEETERLRNALGISKDYEEGEHWDRKREKASKSINQSEEKTFIKR